ncbi:MAG: hypothetical protein U1E55_04880 [Paracoccus sp. (in: a-proteobacteria)]
MFDPLENARYAARFVAQLYSNQIRRQARHSRTQVYAQRYLARFDTLRDLYNQHGFQA